MRRDARWATPPARRRRTPTSLRSNSCESSKPRAAIREQRRKPAQTAKPEPARKLSSHLRPSSEPRYTRLTVGRQSYTNYGLRADAYSDPVASVARYACQADSERLIVDDVVTKLSLLPTDVLLEIGCGPGTLLIPLAFRCQLAVGIDNAPMLRRLHERLAGPPTIESIAGNFLDLDVNRRFDAILVYATLHYLASTEEAERLVRKAAALLAPSGRMLLGDLPNADKKRRFDRSPAGIEFAVTWARRMADEPMPTLLLPPDDELIGSFTDADVLRLLAALRSRGYETYLLPQAAELPFGHTREDILVVAPATSEGAGPDG